MPEHFKHKLIIGLIIGLIVLPVVISLLRRGVRTWFKKLLAGGAMFLLAIDVAAIVILLLIRFGGLEMEWRGGYVPVVTWNKTKPDFDALERSRKEQKLAQQPVVVIAPAVSNQATWPGFRGAHQDGHYDDGPILTNWPT